MVKKPISDPRTDRAQPPRQDILRVAPVLFVPAPNVPPPQSLFGGGGFVQSYASSYSAASAAPQGAAFASLFSRKKSAPAPMFQSSMSAAPASSGAMAFGASPSGRPPQGAFGSSMAFGAASTSGADRVKSSGIALFGSAAPPPPPPAPSAAPPAPARPAAGAPSLFGSSFNNGVSDLLSLDAPGGYGAAPAPKSIFFSGIGSAAPAAQPTGFSGFSFGSAASPPLQPTSTGFSAPQFQQFQQQAPQMQQAPGADYRERDRDRSRVSADPLEALARLQAFDGCFSLEVLTVITLKSNIQTVHAAFPAGATDGVVATVLAMAFLSTKLGAKVDRDSWEGIYEKAQQYVEAALWNMGAAETAEALEAKVAQLLA